MINAPEIGTTTGRPSELISKYRSDSPAGRCPYSGRPDGSDGSTSTSNSLRATREPRAQFCIVRAATSLGTRRRKVVCLKRQTSDLRADCEANTSELSIYPLDGFPSSPAAINHLSGPLSRPGRETLLMVEITWPSRRSTRPAADGRQPPAGSQHRPGFGSQPRPGSDSARARPGRANISFKIRFQLFSTSRRPPTRPAADRPAGSLGAVCGGGLRVADNGRKRRPMIYGRVSCRISGCGQPVAGPDRPRASARQRGL